MHLFALCLMLQEFLLVSSDASSTLQPCTQVQVQLTLEAHLKIHHLCGPVRTVSLDLDGVDHCRLSDTKPIS